MDSSTKSLGARRGKVKNARRHLTWMTLGHCWILTVDLTRILGTL
jgi:hypothetical protein